MDPAIEEVPYRGAQPPILWDGDTPYIDPRFMKDFSTYEQDVEAGRAAPSWEEAREAGDTGPQGVPGAPAPGMTNVPPVNREFTDFILKMIMDQGLNIPPT